MKMYVQFDFNILCKKILNEKLKEYGLKYKLLSLGEVEFYERLTQEEHGRLKKNLEDYGIEIIMAQKTTLVHKIKSTITDLVYSEDIIPVKVSIYIAEKLNHSYGYLSSMFSEITFTSIEHFIILQKIEHAKELIVANKQTLTEIANKLNYSSVAHLSTQFKNTTGITPSQFYKIVLKRRASQFISMNS